MLLISGTGRNSGKTTLACKVISEFADQRLMIGLKIGSHMHEPTSGLILIHADKNFMIYRETNLNSMKDTSLMLQSGAVNVFYIQSEIESLKAAIVYFMENVSEGHAIVCESPALREIVIPGLFFVCHNQNIKDPKPGVPGVKEKADLFTIFDGTSFDPEISSLSLEGMNWALRSIRND